MAEDVNTQETVAPDDVNEEVVEPQEEEESQESQSATEEQAVTQEEEQRVPYDRFKEKVDEANFYKDQLLRYQQQPAQQPAQQPKQDEFAGMDAETEKFWRLVDARADARAEVKFKKANEAIHAGKQQLAQIQADNFYKSHPDIKPNSPEANDIGRRVNAGYQLEDAYWAVMGPRGVKNAEVRVKQQSKKMFQQKKKANVETSGISSQGGHQGTKGFREKTGSILDDVTAGKYDEDD